MSRPSSARHGHGEPLPAAAAANASVRSPMRASSSASTAAASTASIAAASTAASAASANGMAVRLASGGWMLPLARVKLAAAARVALASERSSQPSMSATMAQRSAALLLPQPIMHAMDLHGGQRIWLADEQRGWYALAHVWPAERVLKAGCRLLLPLHSSSPLVDGSRCVVSPVLQPLRRADSITLRPRHSQTSLLLAEETPGSARIRQIMTSVLTAVIAGRDVFVGSEVCVSLFDEEYSFAVSLIDCDSDGAAGQPQRSAAAEQKEETQRTMPLMAQMQPSRGDEPATADSAVFPPLYSVAASTRVLLSDAPRDAAAAQEQFAASDAIDADAIGGLTSEIAALRELISLPLLQPQLFSSFAIKPPKGILLYGPPGTGKTMLAKAVAQQSFASFYLINGPEIVSKYVGESEAKLSSVFALARRNAPSVIFVDEIDSLCPKRDESSDEMQKRIVASLLTLMDGATGDAGGSGGDSSGGNSSGSGVGSTVDDRVVVIGATNRPDALDTALRRAGRFDREMEIGIPNERKRADILQRMLRKMPHALSDAEVAQVASVTHGYVGADLKAVCREAALVAFARWQQQQPDWAERLRAGPSGAAAAPAASAGSADGPRPSSGGGLLLTHGDFASALPSVKPSAMRSVVVDVPKVAWSDIGGQEDVKQKLREAVDWPLQHPSAFLRLGISPPKGLLLYGPPGGGKTLMAKALASSSSRNFIAVKGPELFSKYVGESEKALKEVFRKARAAAPSIVFFDEIDSIAAKRGDGGAGGGEGGERVAHRVLSQLLTELDGIEPLREVTVLAATNRPDMIDAALMRPGRIDRILYVQPPDEQSCAAILSIEFRRIGPAAAGLDASLLAPLAAGLSGAEIAALCREAAVVAMEEDTQARVITQQHVAKARARITPRITREMLQFYDDYRRASAVASV